MQNILSFFKDLLLTRLSVHSGKPFRNWSATTFSLFPAVLFCIAILFSVPAFAAHSYEPADFLGMPLEYGTVIYRINGDSPKQLYIIGISHRDPESGLNSSTTIQTQTEIFRIGEWLNRNRSLQLLLPEGYFAGGDGASPTLSQPSPDRLDNILLRQQLADESRFVNAEMLLMENFQMRASQVEDKRMYDAVHSSLRNLKTTGSAQSSPEERLAELQYLQEIRTAMLLQKIPSVIDKAIHNGTIHNQSAMFTIGLNHIQDIVRYFQTDAIHIDSPLSAPMQSASFSSELNLLKTGYGVTIIIPRTLAEDRKLLQLTNIDRILLAYGSQTGKEWMN